MLAEGRGAPTGFSVAAGLNTMADNTEHVDDQPVGIVVFAFARPHTISHVVVFAFARPHTTSIVVVLLCCTAVVAAVSVTAVVTAVSVAQGHVRGLCRPSSAHLGYQPVVLAGSVPSAVPQLGRALNCI